MVWKIVNGKVLAAINHIKNAGLPLDLTKSCTHYYWVTWYTDCVNNTTKGLNGCTTWSSWDYMYSVCDGDDGGSGGSGGDGGYQQSPHVDAVYDSSSTLTDAQQQSLEQAISYFHNANPIYAHIWQTICGSNSKITFKIDSTIDGLGALSIDGRTMFFKAPDYINEGVVREELIHKYQSLQYGASFNSNIRNYEFEARVLKDIVGYIYGGPVQNVTPYFLLETEKTIHLSWIQNVATGGPFNSSTFNNYCQNWHYPPNSQNSYNPDFVPIVINEFASTNFIISGGTIMY